MYRRALLTTAAIGVASVAGCVDGGEPLGDGSSDAESTDDDGSAGDDGSGDGDSADDTDEGGGGDDESTSESSGIEVDDNPNAQSVDISEVDPMAAGEASIDFAADTVHVEGTVVGETGCHGVELENARTTDEGVFRVVVAAVDDGEPDEMCTQALTEIGYEVDASFEAGVPESVTVVHDDAAGQEVVATDSPDGDE